MGNENREEERKIMRENMIISTDAKKHLINLLLFYD